MLIEDHGMIGDLHTAALVAADGTVDWLCLPRFDSASCFASLLGDESAGFWRIAPTDEQATSSQAYRDTTLVLETTFSTASGSAKVVDVMPPRDDRVDLVRVVEGLDGEVEMRMRWAVRFAYGVARPWVRRVTEAGGDEVVLALAGPDAVSLHSSVTVEAVDDHHEAVFTVRPGETVRFVMTWFPSHEDPPGSVDAAEAVERTEQFWREWVSGCRYDGPHSQVVRRSLATLKALTFGPTGGMVAAATTSLPELIGGARNWDYRYCWLRDASLTLHAFLDCGFGAEAQAWRDWLLRAIAGDPKDLQIVYGIAGERQLPETELGHLAGYEGSVPVRIGNSASGQFQLDIYGEVMEMMAQVRASGLGHDEDAWRLQLAIMEQAADDWTHRDRSLWEMRGEPRHFTHSKIMCWVALDRAVRAVEEHGFEGPVEHWRTQRDAVHADVMSRGWNDEVGSFTQYYGGTALDAALLMIPLVGFLPPDHPRVTATVAAVIERLAADGLVMRYDADAGTDGLVGDEGAFVACSFWLVEALALTGQTEQAQRRFDELVALAGPTGMLAEEYDLKAGRQVGNYPQAFSHLALVSAALTLADPSRRGIPQEG